MSHLFRKTLSRKARTPLAAFAGLVLAMSAQTASATASVQVAQAQRSTVAADLFAAIAYSPTEGTYGYSYGYSRAIDARYRAVGECIDRGGKSCRWRISVRNAWAALAQSKNNHRYYGVGWSVDRGDARANALEQCNNNANAGCRVLVVVHS